MSGRRRAGGEMQLTRTRRAGFRHTRRLATIAGVIVAALLGAATSPASAYWSVTSAPGGAGTSAAASVNRAATPLVAAAQNDITIDWDPSTLSSGAPVTGYSVIRYDSANVAQPVLAGCSGVRTTTVCTEVNVPDGLWTWGIVPRLGANWVGPESARSAQVRSDGTAPTTAITRVAASGGLFKSGNTVFFAGATGGSMTLRTAMTDAGSGVASAATGSLTGTVAGWSHTSSTVSTPTGGPFVSPPFTWIAGTTSSPRVVVTGRDLAGNSRSTTITFTPDDTAPAGGSVSYADGPTSATSVVVALGTVSDGQSGIASRFLQRSTASLTGSTCGSFSPFANLVTNPGASVTTAIVAGTCYRYQYVVTDRVGNVLTSVPAGASTVKARSYSAIVRATPGLVNYWRLGDAGTVIDDIAPANNNGTYSGAPALGAAGAIAGDSNTAVSFDGVDDYGRVTRQVQDSLSIEFWFSSTQGIGAGPQWYDGAGLVDADVPGVADDFGVSLTADGRIAAGMGNPDGTLFSAPGYNDGAWHHVVITRDRTSGEGVVYVDGAAVASAVAGTASLTGSATIDFGRIHTGTNYFAGALDEIAVYGGVLTPAEVSNHYASGQP